MYLAETKGMLDKHHSGTSHSAVGCEVNVNESTTYAK